MNNRRSPPCFHITLTYSLLCGDNLSIGVALSFHGPAYMNDERYSVHGNALSCGWLLVLRLHVRLKLLAFTKTKLALFISAIRYVARCAAFLQIWQRVDH